MARARNIKPSFFKNIPLSECDPFTRLLFIGLWTLADREGRLVDEPRRIKVEVLPYDDCNCDEMLSKLATLGLIRRYVVGDEKFIWIPKFVKHQNPHIREAVSELPEFKDEYTSTVQAQCLDVPSTGRAQPLTPYPLPLTESPLPHTDAPFTNDVDENQKKEKTSERRLAKRIESELGENPIPPAEWVNWSTSKYGWDQSRVDEAFREFFNYWKSESGQRSRKLDWYATWQNRCADIAKREARDTGSYRGRNHDKTASAIHSVVARRYGTAQPSGGERGGDATQTPEPKQPGFSLDTL